MKVKLDRNMDLWKKNFLIALRSSKIGNFYLIKMVKTLKEVILHHKAIFSNSSHKLQRILHFPFKCPYGKLDGSALRTLFLEVRTPLPLEPTTVYIKILSMEYSIAIIMINNCVLLWVGPTTLPLDLINY
jgi:hypothetical protein